VPIYQLGTKLHFGSTALFHHYLVQDSTLTRMQYTYPCSVGTTEYYACGWLLYHSIQYCAEAPTVHLTARKPAVVR
jgi:hypothetical protein